MSDGLGPGENPYLKAASSLRIHSYFDIRQAWRRERRRFWIVSAALLVGFLAHLGVDLGRTPAVHVLEVDRFGRALLYGPLPQLADLEPSRWEIRYALEEFITRARSIPSDPVALDRELKKAFGSLQGRAHAYATDWYKANNPYERVTRHSVTVDVTTVLAEDSTSERWSVEWEETVREGGVSVRREPWRALITIALDPDVRDIEERFNNPWGLRIIHLDWSRKLNGETR